MQKPIPMPNYQIKLTPVDTFFFGGEKHKLNDNKQLVADYFVESNPYPQQTTMLGMLRYYLLYRSGNLIFPNLNKAERGERKIAGATLIGKRSFTLNDTNQFGKIQRISPLYFLNKNKAYHFAPLDYNFEYSNGALIDDEGNLYNAKDHHYPISKQHVINGNDLKELSTLIKDVQHTGNKKAKPGDSNSEGLYKMNKKKIENDWCFAFDTIIDLNDLDGEENYIPFGGEKSIFKIEFKQIEVFNTPTMPTQYKRDSNTPLLYFASDAFIQNEDLKMVDFAINQFVSFRCMQSTIKTKNYNNLLNQNSYKNASDKKKKKIIKKGLLRSNRHQLLKRGSVLYFNDENERTKLIQNLGTSEKEIGFNHYLKN